MKIEKAIEINTKELAPQLVGKKIEWQEAFGLGIEAMKFFTAWREGRYFPAAYNLPGETKE